MVRKKVLGSRVDMVNQAEAVRQITDWIESDDTRARLIATAYSEFFVTAMKDSGFRATLEACDLVTPDGVGPLAAIRYKLLIAHCSSLICRLVMGVRVGVDVLRGRVGETVSGYWLFRELIRTASENGWRVFLLGGFGETANKLAKKLQIIPKTSRILGKAGTNHKLQIMADAGAQSGSEMVGEENDRVIAKINKFRPDLLFVAYGPVKQEKWLVANRKDLRVKVAMGVGGTFDEALGLVKEAPVAFSKYGLKWLWRLLQQPRRLPRILKATFVFAWLVFAESLGEK